MRSRPCQRLGDLGRTRFSGNHRQIRNPHQHLKVRRNDMHRLLVATKGMVFTLASIEHLVAHTRIRDFVTRPIPSDMM